MVDVVLHPGRDRAVRRRHPWLLSGAVDRLEGTAEPGAWCRVLSAEGEVLAYGHLSPESRIRVRLLCFGKELPAPGFLEERIEAAVARRSAVGLIGETDAVRLVNAEGDGLPGLIVDRYADLVVVKLGSAGMVMRREKVAAALRRATGAAAGFERADTASARREGVPVHEGVLWGSLPESPVTIREGSRRYLVDFRGGQKTGFYLDQRDARDWVARVASGRRVLDLFSYTGGFAVAAAAGAAAELTLVESSAVALDLARRNLAANAPGFPAHFERTDAFEFLRRESGPYDLMIVDPPPLARRRHDVTRASRAHKDLLMFALRRAAPGALILAFTCSHPIGPDLFRKIAFGAALDAGRSARVLHTLGAPSDHPVSIDHPEGHYLSGLLLQT